MFEEYLCTRLHRFQISDFFYIAENFTMSARSKKWNDPEFWKFCHEVIIYHITCIKRHIIFCVVYASFWLKFSFYRTKVMQKYILQQFDMQNGILSLGL